MTEEAKLYRCMGGPRCSHIPGSCTATNSEYQAKAKARAHPPAAPTDALVEALREMFEAVCGETGFAQAVRAESGLAYPWPALDLAEAKARAALAAMQEAKP